MNKLLLTLAVAAIGMSGASAQTNYVTVDATQVNNGYMNVFDLSGNYEWGSGWGIADLNSSYSNGGFTLTLSPNTIGDPNPYWYTPSGQVGATGNHRMQGNIYAESTGVINGQTLVFQGTVSSFSLSTNSAGIPYTAQVFIKDFASDFSSFVDSTYNITSTGAFEISLATINDPSRHVQWGLQIYGPNIWGEDSAQLATAGSVTVDAIPEPSTYAMLALSAAGLGAHMIRRRRR